MNYLERERSRLAAVHALQWLESAAHGNFDRICRLAAIHFDVPTVLISLVEKDRQWFAGRVGFEASETPIEQSFCRYAIEGQGVMVVPDALLDTRFVNNALVVKPGGIRFYAGAPLRSRHGHKIGSLCIIDVKPRQLRPEEVVALEDYAQMVMMQIEHCHLLKYQDANSRLPNLNQFLIDTQGLALSKDHVQLMVVIRIQPIQPATELSVVSNVDAQQLLREVAQRLRYRLESVAELYHVSELDFCLQVSCDSHRRDSLFRALLALITEPSADHSVHVGLSFCDSGQQTAAALMRKATLAVAVALYRHEPWAAFDEAEDCAQRRALALLNDFSDSLTNGDIYLDYQPRFSLKDGRLLSVEALIRWTHPTLGQISPAEFIPLIESAGKISSVSRWVINRSLDDLAGWQDQDIRLAINLSPLDFRTMDIAQALESACHERGIAASRLEVEITEGEWMRSDKSVITQLRNIRDLGVDVAIDDFGTGYSNFAYLHEIPANILKLDRSLVTDLEHSPRNRIITRSVLQLAKDLGYRTVAEGVETFRCMSLVREFGCEEAQGYFLSRPLPVAHFERHSRNIALTFVSPAPVNDECYAAINTAS
jgi:EAL domain-containing protein (putative c-di-GMP-specific phosphodiesterase class I)